MDRTVAVTGGSGKTRQPEPDSQLSPTSECLAFRWVCRGY
jgi:hypothetical protein